jgi:hypothetical protein
MPYRLIVRAVIALGLCGAAAACSSAPSASTAGGSSDRATASTTGHPASSGIASYMRACAADINSVLKADLRYIAHITVRDGQAESYTASLVLSAAASLAPPRPSESNVPLQVECRAGAELVGEDAGVTVGPVGWRYEQFTAVSPALKWDWTVTGADLGNSMMRLDIQPAVIDNSGKVITSSTIYPVEVSVRVTGTAAQKAAHDASTTKRTLAAILLPIAGILGIFTVLFVAVGKFRKAVLDLLPGRRKQPAPRARNVVTNGKAARKPAQQRRGRRPGGKT